MFKFDSEKNDETDNEIVDGTGDVTDVVTGHKKPKKIFKWIKIGILVCVWAVFTGSLMSFDEKELEHRQFSVSEADTKSYIFHEKPLVARVGITLEGAFLVDHYGNLTENFLYAYVQLVYTTQTENLSSLNPDQITQIEVRYNIIKKLFN